MDVDEDWHNWPKSYQSSHYTAFDQGSLLPFVWDRGSVRRSHPRVLHFGTRPISFLLRRSTLLVPALPQHSGSPAEDVLDSQRPSVFRSCSLFPVSALPSIQDPNMERAASDSQRSKSQVESTYSLGPAATKRTLEGSRTLGEVRALYPAG
jgi:hypothetical protein